MLRWTSIPTAKRPHCGKRLAAQLHVPLECLVAGNGSSELLYLIALAYFQPNDTVVIVGPTYGEYARVAALMGTRVVACDAAVENGFAVPAQVVADVLKVQRPRALFLCRPNNPTGQTIAANVVKQWLADFPQTLLVVDEAYIEFSPTTESLIDVEGENLVILRSLTKAYGLAGLRLGYAVGHAEVIRALARVRPPWSVNSLAQAAGIAAIGDQHYVQQSVLALLAEKESLTQSLAALGLAACPSATHFFLLRVPSAAQVRRQLLTSRILVRDCTSFGLPDHLRLSPRRRNENSQLLAALQQIITGNR